MDLQRPLRTAFKAAVKGAGGVKQQLDAIRMSARRQSVQISASNGASVKQMVMLLQMMMLLQRTEVVDKLALGRRAIGAATRVKGVARIFQRRQGDVVKKQKSSRRAVVVKRKRQRLRGTEVDAFLQMRMMMKMMRVMMQGTGRRAKTNPTP